MARIVTEDFEGGTLDATITSSGTVFDYVRNGPTYTNGLIGNLAASFSRTATADQYAQVPFSARSTLYVRAYVQRVSTGTTIDIARVLNSSATISGALRITGAGNIQMRTSNTNVGSASSVPVPTDDAARIEWAITPTAMQARVYVGANKHGDTPDWDSGPVAFTPAATFDRIHVGIVTNGTNVELTVDEFALDSSEWVGTAVEPDPEPTLIPHWFYDNGTAMVDVSTEVWADLGTHWHNITTGDTDGGGLLQHDRIAYLGDSLTRQDTDGSPKVNASLGSLGWDTTHRRVSGHIGRPIIGTNGITTTAQACEAIIAGWRGEDWHPRVWVVALGANNIFNSQSSWTNDMNNLLDIIAEDGPARVYIVGQVFQLASENAGSTYAGLEDDMQARWDAIATARTDLDVRPIDLRALWRAHFNGGSEAGYWTGGDGRHNTAAGYDLRNTLIGTVIGTEAP